MKAEYEVNAKSQISEELSEETRKQLTNVKLCVQKIQNKNGIDKVTGKLNTDTNEVTLVLLNYSNGADTDKVDNENAKIIDLLKTFDAKISSKVPFQHSYWSQSQITLPYQKIENVIESLELLDDVPQEPRMIARC